MVDVTITQRLEKLARRCARDSVGAGAVYPDLEPADGDWDAAHRMLGRALTEAEEVAFQIAYAEIAGAAPRR